MAVSDRVSEYLNFQLRSNQTPNGSKQVVLVRICVLTFGLK